MPGVAECGTRCPQSCVRGFWCLCAGARCTCAGLCTRVSLTPAWMRASESGRPSSLVPTLTAVTLNGLC